MKQQARQLNIEMCISPERRGQNLVSIKETQAMLSSSQLEQLTSWLFTVRLTQIKAITTWRTLY